MEYASLIGSILQLPFNIAADVVQIERNAKSDQEFKKAIAEAYGIDIPDEKLMQIKQAKVEHQKDIATDPALRGEQLNALRKLSGIADAGGMDPQSKAALQEAQYAAQKQYADSSASLMRQQMARGTADSGNAMANNLAAASTSANMLNRAGVQAAGDARARALQAISESGRLAGNVRNADFGEAANNRDAWNEIEKFNQAAGQAAAQQTASNLLNRTGAQTARAGAITNAASQYANNGRDQGKPVRQLGSDVTNPLQTADKLGIGRKK